MKSERNKQQRVSVLVTVDDSKEVLAFRAEALVVKNPPAKAGDVRDADSIPGWGRSPGGVRATHSSTLAWRITWTEEPEGTVHRGAKSQTWLE